MNLLTIDKLSKHLGEHLLFHEADLRINHGDRIGLIGINGSGKSTLLRIAAGLEAPDSGIVTVWGGVRIEYLSQDPSLDDRLTVMEEIYRSDSPQMRLLLEYERTSNSLQTDPHDPDLQARMMMLSGELDRSGGWAAEANAKAVLTRLGVRNLHAPIGTLSGGQRKRVALARVLIDRADLLILDEPTNHLDAETVAWLEEYLATTPGALLMVTHDRYFLDRVVNRILELDRRQIVSYSGNYAAYLEERTRRHERMAEADQKRKKLLRRELEWLRRTPMARGTKQKARAARVDDLLQIRRDSGEQSIAIQLVGQRLGKRVLAAEGLSKSFGAQTALNDVDFRLEPGDRIGIVGPNGAGKSTLLDILAGRLQPDRGSVRWGETVEIGYYDQGSDDLRDDLRLLEFIEEEASLIRSRSGERVEAALMLEWFLFPRAMQWARIGSLSGGERRRLYLLKTLVHRPNILLLDEPTNDLDIQTLAVLEEFLDEFGGCLVVASHDRYFLDRTVDHLMYMEHGTIGPRYPAPYVTFVRLQSEAERQAAAPPPPDLPKSKPPRPEEEPPSRRLSWRQARDLAELEARITALEDEKTTLEQAMAECGDDYTRLQALARRLTSVEEDLENCLDRWLPLAELAETQ